MLYQLTLTEIINNLINNIIEEYPKMKRTKAKQLVLNALIANCVNEAIMEQIKFLEENDGY